MQIFEFQVSLWWSETQSNISRHAGVCSNPVCAADSVGENMVMEASTIVFTQWRSLLSEMSAGPAHHSVRERSCSFIVILEDVEQNLLCKTETGSPVSLRSPHPPCCLWQVWNAVTGFRHRCLVYHKSILGPSLWPRRVMDSMFTEWLWWNAHRKELLSLLHSSRYNTFKLLYAGMCC